MKASATPFADPFVFTKKTVYMQRIADLIGTGHIQYVQGIVAIEKAGFFVKTKGSAKSVAEAFMRPLSRCCTYNNRSSLDFLRPEKVTFRIAILNSEKTLPNLGVNEIGSAGPGRYRT